MTAAEPLQRVCKVPECSDAPTAKSLCGLHYKRAARGAPLDAPVRKSTPRRPALTAVSTEPATRAAPRAPEMPADQLAVLQLVVAESQGSILGSPTDVAREVRRVADAVGADGELPVTGVGLAAWLARYTDSLALAGFLVRHTVRGEPDDAWHCEFVAVSDVAADLRARDAHPTPTIDPTGLVYKIELTLRHLCRDTSAWVGTADELRQAWRRVLGAIRNDAPGRPWSTDNTTIRNTVALGLAELEHRGVLVHLDGDHITAELTDQEDPS